MIPILDLQRQYQSIKEELDSAVLDVLASGRYVLGPNVKELEHELAAYIQVPRTVALASGTDALRIALAALSVKSGDEVITTPFSFIATANTISRAGATPVFADIDPRTFNLDPASVEQRITPRTRGIVVVHLYGQPADMDALSEIAERHGLWVVEDACQALGATWHDRPVGSLGVAGCFSFYPTKNLGAAGDAGLLSSQHESFAETVEMLARHGSRRTYYAEAVGFNSRLDEIQAAILRVKLRYLDEWTEGRRRVAARYDELLRDSSVAIPARQPHARHVYHQYTLQAPRRDELATALHNAGISTMIYYPTPMHLQPLYRDLGIKLGSLPHSETAAEHVLSLPIYPELTDDQIETVAGAIRSFYGD